MHVTNPAVLPIEGLLYIPDFLTDDEHDKLIELIDSNDFSSVIHRRQQYYGETYYHTTHDLSQIQPINDALGEKYYSLEPLEWLIDKFFDEKYSKYEIFKKDGSNYPTQCLVNEYVRNQGIASHFDDSNAFGDVITSISLGDPVYMTLKMPQIQTNQCQTILKETKIFLEPKSLLVMKGEVRNKWRHGITKTKKIEHPVSKQIIKRDESFRRLSLTIRKVLDGRKRTAVEK